MSVGAGPLLPTNGLVLYYDMANTKKSFKGAPTTNMQTNTGQLSLWNKSSGISSVVDSYLPSPFGMSNVSLVTPTGLAGSYISNSASFVSGNTYTRSVYARAGSSGVVVFEAYDNNGAGGTAFLPTTYDLLTGVVSSNSAGSTASMVNCGGGWYRCILTRTYSLNCLAGVIYIGAYGIGTGSVYLCCPQTELGSFATPYVPSTATQGNRSNTQTIMDLTGLNTLTAGSLTYNTDNTFSFDGTTNFMRPTAPISCMTSSCCEYVFKAHTLPATSKYATLFGYSGLVGYSEGAVGLTYLNSSGKIIGSVITTSQVYRQVISSTTINTNKFYHIIFNKNTSTGVMELYINGMLDATQTFDAATYAFWGGSYITVTTLDIGQNINTSQGQWVPNYFDGDIPLIKMYNRILSSTDVAQNFSVVKARFGI